MRYVPTIKGQALRDILQYEIEHITDEQLLELEKRGVSLDYILSTDIYEQSVDSKTGETMLIPSGANQDVAYVIAAFYAYPEGATFDQIQSSIKEIFGIFVLPDIVDRAVWTGLAEQTL